MNMKNTHETSATILRKYQDMILENQEEVDEAKDEELDENQEEVDESKDEELDEAKDEEVDESKDEDDDKEEVKETAREIPSTPTLRYYQDMIKEAEADKEEVDESKDEDDDKEEVDESKDEEEVDEGIKRTPDPQIGKGVGKYSGNPEMEKDLASVGLQKPMARATARGRMHGAKQPKHGGTGFGG